MFEGRHVLNLKVTRKLSPRVVFKGYDEEGRLSRGIYDEHDILYEGSG